MTHPPPNGLSAVGWPLLFQVDLLDRLLSDPLGQILAALMALVVAVWATIRNDIIKSYLQSIGEQVRFYAERNRQKDDIHHRVGVTVSDLLWAGLFGRLGEVEQLGEDPVEWVREALDEDGFTWLSAAEVEEGTLDQQNCWRRPFSFREIHEGFAIDRQRPRPGGRENVTEALLDGLNGGTVHAVVGHSGSGKSTICKAVASRWYGRSDLGPVFYRPSGEGGAISDAAVLEEWIEVGKRIGPVLVVVEDAVRRDAIPIFETIRTYQSDMEVSFLLDAREHEWDTDFEDAVRGLAERPDTSRRRALEGLRSEIDRHEVPPIDVREVERVIERFETVTGRDVHEGPEELLRQVRLEEEDFAAAGRRAEIGWPSPMLLLTYHFPIGIEGPNREAKPSSLQENVEELLETIEATDTGTLGIETADLLQEVTLLINILNASGIGVYEELLYALANTDEGHEAIERCTDELDGSVLFGRSRGTRYRSNHPLWSELYLETFLERNRENWARKRFEACVNALFELVDEEDRRDRIQRELGRATDEFRQIEAEPTERADAYVEKVFELGNARPKLAPLFGTSAYSGIQVPEACSEWTRVNCSYWRSEMYRTLGEYKIVAEEIDTFRNTGLDAGLDEEEVESAYLLNKGELHLTLNNYSEANRLFDSCLDIARGIGNRHHEATALNGLGIIAQNHGDFESAQEYYEKSLDTIRDLGNRADEARTLNNLGTVAHDQGDYKSAREYYEKSLGIARDIGNRARQADALNNLGIVAQNHGEYERAWDYYKQSLDIRRDLGNRAGEGQILNNLGTVAYDQGDYERARKYYKESLDIARDVRDRAPESRALNNLGTIAQEQGDYERAREYYEKSLEMKRDLGHRADEAKTLIALGNVARDQVSVLRTIAKDQVPHLNPFTHDQGDYERARESHERLREVYMKSQERARGYYEKSLDITRNIGDRASEGMALHGLGTVAYNQGDYASAREYHEAGLEILREIGAIRQTLLVLDNLVYTCHSMDDDESAIEWCEKALSIIGDSDLELSEERERFESYLNELNTPEENDR